MRALADRILCEFATGFATGFATAAWEYATGAWVCHWGRSYATGGVGMPVGCNATPAPQRGNQRSGRVAEICNGRPEHNRERPAGVFPAPIGHSAPQCHTPSPNCILLAPMACSAPQWHTPRPSGKLSGKPQWQTSLATTS